MEYFKTPSRPFDICAEDDKEAPKNPKDFIVWVADTQPSTRFNNGRLHCSYGAFRSLDDIYHLVNKRWPMSQDTFLMLVGEGNKGNHSFKPHWDKSIKLFLYFNFCYFIRRVVVHTSVFQEGRRAHNWLYCYKAFSNPLYVKPELKEYLLKHF